MLDYLKSEKCSKNEEYFLKENLNFSIENYNKIFDLIETIEKNNKNKSLEDGSNKIKIFEKMKNQKNFFTPKKIKKKNIISSLDCIIKNSETKDEIKKKNFYSEKEKNNSEKEEDILSNPSLKFCLKLKKKKKEKKNFERIQKKKIKKNIEVFRNIILPKEKIPEFFISKIWINKLLEKNKINLFQYESEKIVLDWIEKFFFFNGFFPEPDEILKYMGDFFIYKNGFNMNWIDFFLERNYGFFKILKQQNPEFD